MEEGDFDVSDAFGITDVLKAEAMLPEGNILREIISLGTCRRPSGTLSPGYRLKLNPSTLCCAVGTLHQNMTGGKAQGVDQPLPRHNPCYTQLTEYHMYGSRSGHSGLGIPKTVDRGEGGEIQCK
jgi:hypothetical protein